MKALAISLSIALPFLFLFSGCNPAIVKDADRGDYESVKKRLDEGLDASDLQHALCVASKKGHLKIVQLLVERGAKVTYWPRAYKESFWKWNTIPSPEPALHYAISGNHFDVVKYLVENGAGVNRDSTIFPLLLAINNQSIQIATFLLSKGADANAFFIDTLNRSTSVDTIRVIYEAAAVGNVRLVNLLKSKGAALPSNRAVLIAGYSVGREDQPWWDQPRWAYCRLQSIDGKSVGWGFEEVYPGVHSVEVMVYAAEGKAGPIPVKIECKQGDLIVVHPSAVSHSSWAITQNWAMIKIVKY